MSDPHALSAPVHQHQTPEQVVCSLSMAERQELLSELGMPSDVHSAALMITLIKQTRSFETSLQILLQTDTQWNTAARKSA